jgi:hypothetical protein
MIARESSSPRIQVSVTTRSFAPSLFPTILYSLRAGIASLLRSTHMESSSQSDIPPKSAASWPAQVIGTLIALLTLAVPILAIAHFSSSDIDVWQPATYPAFRVKLQLDD